MYRIIETTEYYSLSELFHNSCFPCIIKKVF